MQITGGADPNDPFKKSFGGKKNAANGYRLQEKGYFAPYGKQDQPREHTERNPAA